MRFIFLASLFFSIGATAQNINIKLFSDFENISRFGFAVDEGRYDVVADDRVITRLNVGQGLDVKSRRKRMKLKAINGRRLGRYQHFYVRGVADTNSFRLKPVEPDYKGREYYDDIIVSFNEGFIDVINDVQFEHYIAGVVESEGGAWSHIEYYKSQAILCRTYAMKNFKRHLNEGYNLCDDVHCQAYKHKCMFNKDIEKACELTKGLVVVDDHQNLISATFYSNSGGQTANSEDVWGFAFPYLRSISDPYSLNQRCFEWEKRIPKAEWIAYLQRNGVDIDFTASSLQFVQDERKKNLEIGGFVLPLKQIRSDWKLRSTFFSVWEDGAEVLLKGKGYGHGVGLAQEGAMKMANEGMGYEDIIKFYYKGVSVTNFDSLGFFKVE